VNALSYLGEIVTEIIESYSAPVFQSGVPQNTRFSRRKAKADGFSRCDLLIAVACVLVLGVFGLSVSGNTRDRSERAICVNNLRQIGRAYNLWASDHGDENPFTVRISEGGLGGSRPPSVLVLPGIGQYPSNLRNMAWLQFLWIYQELQTPTVLVCPSDILRRRASEFSNDSTKGFAHTNFQDSAISYFIWLHALKETPSSPLCGDRHIQYTGYNSSCYTGVGNAWDIHKDNNNNSLTSWTRAVHPDGGNLVRNDGSVAEVTSPGLRALIDEIPDADNGSHHFIVPGQ